ncbi:PREDICTED: DNA-directed RNA polymerase III subunit RPC8-like [Priapulus caudatus]|uniref:DNA-directed RNA polymerase III subunit RPC8-like n=1 Tax=Priapulus caudatus TaxID=37621 RepID=A0ABM1EEI8_PRICU|nr:PREDICTED: DNA-directed RNA polymerase III subunit RPC8-like [Priapulus caudatus]
MFVLTDMTDVVKVPPWMFNLKLNEAVEQELNKKFANKVVHKLGLCIALYDISKLEDSHVFPGDGSSHTKVHFRCVVFRPFMDEVVVGKIRSSSKEGVYVSLGFFDDILIPSDSLQHPSRFDVTQQQRGPAAPIHLAAADDEHVNCGRRLRHADSSVGSNFSLRGGAALC